MKKKEFPDINETAFDILRSLTGEPSKPAPVKKATKRKKSEDTTGELPSTNASSLNGKIRTKNAAAVALGRLGGRKGGPARAKKLSSSKRSAIAKLAAKARWGDGPN